MQQERLDEGDLSPDEREAEQALGQLTPLHSSIEVGHIQATAMQRREGRRVGFWRCVSAGLAACLIAAMWPRQHLSPIAPAGQSVLEVPMSPQQAGNISLASTADLEPRPSLLSTDANENYLQLRQRVLQRGVNGLIQQQFLLRHSAPGPSVSQTEQVVERAIQPPAPKGPIFQFLRVLSNGSEI